MLKYFFSSGETHTNYGGVCHSCNEDFELEQLAMYITLFRSDVKKKYI